MKKKPTAPLLASLCAVLLVIVLVICYLMSSGVFHRNASRIELPSGAEEPIAVSPGTGGETPQLSGITITAENAQLVLASMKRATAYRYRVENKLYYGDQSSVLYAARYARGDAVRTDQISAGGVVQSTLLRVKNTIYAWDAGETSYYQGVEGVFGDDAATMLPTYEDALAPSVTIDAAKSVVLDGEVCVELTFAQNGYRCVYAVSTANGLLKHAAFYDEEDTLKREVSVRDISTESPTSDYFLLPNGQSVIGE